MKKILIIGATSAIAQATARIYAAQGCKILLIGRNPNKLEIISDDLRARGANGVEYMAIDLNETEKHEQLIHQATQNLRSIDIALIAHGTLPSQSELEKSYTNTLTCLQSNALSVISLLTALANFMQKQQHGCIAVISSVAGDRGRKSNYIYGSAKAMVSTFTQGLRNRLFKHGVYVTTIKPGFVDTPMTAEFKKGLLWAQPQTIANAIVRACEKNQNIVYTPFFWRYIMLIIKAIPEALFKRLSL